METPTWRNTFNSKLGQWGGIDGPFRVASFSGYLFVAWNDKVYNVDNRAETGYIVEEEREEIIRLI